MCTFVFAWRVFEEAPIVVAANRDERLDRRSRLPKTLDDDPRVIAPQDDEARGTWIGYNEDGVIASVTNRWTDFELVGERSRGLLVRDALGRRSAAAAIALAQRRTEEHEYDGFNLVVLDRERAVLLEWNGELKRTEFDPGVHIVVNVGADEDFEIPATRSEPGRAQAKQTKRALTALEPDPGESPEGWLERTVSVLRDHDYGFCVHENGFGTRSSSLLTLDTNGAVEYRFADGPPCETNYRDVEVSAD